EADANDYDNPDEGDSQDTEEGAGGEHLDVVLQPDEQRCRTDEVPAGQAEVDVLQHRPVGEDRNERQDWEGKQREQGYTAPVPPAVSRRHTPLRTPLGNDEIGHPDPPSTQHRCPRASQQRQTPSTLTMARRGQVKVLLRARFGQEGSSCAARDRLDTGAGSLPRRFSFRYRAPARRRCRRYLPGARPALPGPRPAPPGPPGSSAPHRARPPSAPDRPAPPAAGEQPGSVPDPAARRTAAPG